MSECTLCGKTVDKIFKAKIEGSIIEVCEKCLKFGERIEEVKHVSKKVKRLAKPLPEESVLVDNYGEVIIRARKKMGLRRKEFAQKISEKQSVIRRVEMQEMVPDIKLRKKIENFLGISLKETREEKFVERKTKTGRLTIGDVVEVE